MLIRKIEDIYGTEREVTAENKNWVSRRLLLKKDGMGFSFHETVIFAGTETHIWYKNHLEAVYCVEGKGEIECLDDGSIHTIDPGTLYALDKNDRHVLRGIKDMKLICVFNPALAGQEVHQEDGSYALITE